MHEHPETAGSWKVDCVEAIAMDPLVLEAHIEQCAYSLVSKDSQGEAPARKPTRVLTNSIALQRVLGKKCPGCHRHVQLTGGKAKAAQVPPKEFCRAVTNGIIEQARMDSAEVFSMVCQDLVDGCYEINHIQHDDDQEDWRRFWDDISGEQLDTNLTCEARADKIKAVHEMGVYRKVPVSMCFKETGKRPIGTRWVDTNKGDELQPKIRSRLVAQELNRSKQPELFAATPPIEFIKFLVSCCASSPWSGRPTRLMVNDVRKAYFYAEATRRVFVALPDEDRKEGEEEMCALLLESLYGTRDAAFNWTAAYTRVLCETLGFAKGQSSPCSFRHEGRGINLAVHGDDFFSKGTAEDLKWFSDELLKHFQIKTEVLGPDVSAGEVPEIRFLNRVIAWTSKGIPWEADPRHAELIIRQLGLEDGKTKPACTPGTKDESKQSKGAGDENEGSDDIYSIDSKGSGNLGPGKKQPASTRPRCWSQGVNGESGVPF